MTEQEEYVFLLNQQLRTARLALVQLRKQDRVVRMLIEEAGVPGEAVELLNLGIDLVNDFEQSWKREGFEI